MQLHLVFIDTISLQSINNIAGRESQLDYAHVKAQRSLYQKLIWYALIVAAVFISLGGVGLSLLGRAFTQHCEIVCAQSMGYEGCFSVTAWLGLLLQVYLVPVGVLALGAAIVELGQLVCDFRISFHSSLFVNYYHLIHLLLAARVAPLAPDWPALCACGLLDHRGPGMGQASQAVNRLFI